MNEVGSNEMQASERGEKVDEGFAEPHEPRKHLFLRCPV